MFLQLQLSDSKNMKHSTVNKTETENHHLSILSTVELV